MLEYSLQVRSGWTVVARDTGLRCFFEPMTSNEEGAVTVQGGTELSFETLVDTGALDEHADRLMKRHVGHGVPEASSRSLDGRDARVYRWTNGVQQIETYFVPTTAATGIRIDAYDAISFDGSSSQDAAVRLLDGLRWRAL